MASTQSRFESYWKFVAIANQRLGKQTVFLEKFGEKFEIWNKSTQTS